MRSPAVFSSTVASSQRSLQASPTEAGSPASAKRAVRLRVMRSNSSYSSGRATAQNSSSPMRYTPSPNTSRMEEQMRRRTSSPSSRLRSRFTTARRSASTSTNPMLSNVPQS